MLVLGVDDAGRGPVIGPMILAGCILKQEDEKPLKDFGVRDSKLLSQKRRVIIEKQIKEKSVSWKTIKITPAEIDSGLGKNLNLNQVEALAVAKILYELLSNISEKEKKDIKIILDCPSINTLSWKNQMLGFLYSLDKNLKNKNLNIICEHKADLKYICAGAASILAKTLREKEISKIKKEIDMDFGSGYPSDPKTIEFIKKNFDNPKHSNIIRHSWKTVKNLEKGDILKKQKKILDF
jgi:ribonuclease HII